eukprot:4495917-Prymnesium_polylepis.1
MTIVSTLSSVIVSKCTVFACCRDRADTVVTAVSTFEESPSRRVHSTLNGDNRVDTHDSTHGGAGGGTHGGAGGGTRLGSTCFAAP